MKRKRTLVKTIFLSLIRFERWKMNPKNIDKMIYLEQYTHIIGYTWIVVLMLTVSSCSPVKKIEKSNLKVDVKTETQVTKTTEEKKDLTTSVNNEKKTDESTKKTASVDENETEETTIHTVNYDPQTKSIASETTTKTVKGKAKKAVESTEILYSANEVTSLFSHYLKSYDSKIDSLNKVNTSLKSEISVTTEQAGNWWKWFLAGIGMAALSWLIIQFKLFRFLSFFSTKK